MQLGQKLFGRLGSYTVQEQLYRTIYSAISKTGEQVIVKTERLTHQLNNEKGILNYFRDSPHTRRLIDEVADPPALVLNRLDGDVLDAAKERPVTGRDLKFVARVVLERLRDMHEAQPQGFVHTDVKPRNILVNYGQEESGRSGRFSEVQLTDFGDAFPTRAVDDLNVKQPDSIGAALWRSPEVMLGLRWGSPTDIWSYGATLLSLAYGGGPHILRPEGGTAEDPDYDFQVLVKQASHFGPFPDAMMERVNEEAQRKMERAWDVVRENRSYRPFEDITDDQLSGRDREFLAEFMKLDSRERPRAGQLLRDSWFEEG